MRQAIGDYLALLLIDADIDGRCGRGEFRVVGHGEPPQERAFRMMGNSGVALTQINDVAAASTLWIEAVRPALRAGQTRALALFHGAGREKAHL